MRPTRRTVLAAPPPGLLPLLALLVSNGLLAVPALAGTDSSDDLRRRIVWDGDSTHALFVPQAVLTALPIGELPLPEPSLRALEARIESIRIQAEQRKLSVGEAVELRLGTSDLSEHPPETIDWMRRKFREMEVRSRADAERHAPCQFRPRASCSAGVLIQEPLGLRQDRQDLAFVGRVIATVPGWSGRSRREVTMVYVEVEEIERDRVGALRVGAVVAFDERRGRIEIDGVTICTAGPGNGPTTRSEPGDLLRIHGGRNRPDHVYVEIFTVEPVDQPALSGAS